MRFSGFLNLYILILALILSGCAASAGDADDETAGMSVAELYQAAKAKLISKDYGDAINYYEKLESRFPYGPYAERARLEVAYAYYKDDQKETAIVAADRYIKLYPNNAHADYAYYLRGLAAFDNTPSFFNKLFDQKPSDRDPQAVRKAFSYFSELIQHFPKSRYIPDAIKRMKELRETLAQYEVNVASYYQRQGAELAAANRAKYVVDNYQGTRAVPDALAIMTTAYRKLGMQDLANDALRVLEMNYPKNEKTIALKQKTAE